MRHTPPSLPYAPTRKQSHELRNWLIAAALLLAWGVRLAMKQEIGFRRFNLVTKAALFLPLLAFIPFFSKHLSWSIARLRAGSRQSRWRVPLIVGASGLLYLATTTLVIGGRFVPVVKDEYSYLLQARMLAAGRLWMPKHEVSDFFESTAVITDPVYASAYPPGNAMLRVPGIWLGLPHWVTSAIIVAAALAMLCRIVTVLVDAWTGVAACLLVLSVGTFHSVWRFAMSQIPMMLFGLLLVGALLNWRATRFRLRWAAAMGAIGGWALLIRPQDAAVYLLPVAVAMLIALRRRPKKVLGSILVSVAAAAPFLALQLLCNVGITGRWNDFPHQLYHRRDLPTLGYGDKASFDWNLRAVSVSPQKQMEFDVERASLRRMDLRNRGDWRHFWNFRVPALLYGTIPSPLITALIPVGLLAIGRRSRWVLALTMPVFLLVYLPWQFVLDHYATVVAPGALLLALLGVYSVERHASRRLRPFVTALFALLVIGVFLSAAPLADRRRLPHEDPVVTPSDIDRLVRKVTSARAVVLLKYDPDNGYRMRPYNLDVANPDDAPVIQALDLGDRDIEIASYYARRQPGRQFFRYDFANDTLTPLGSATEFSLLLQNTAATAPTRTAEQRP